MRLHGLARCALAFFALGMLQISVHASVVTDSYQFANSDSLGNTVTGTFTYNTSAPSVLTDLTMTVDGNTFDSATSFDPPVLPTFDGSELVGNFDLDYISAPVLVDDSGTFGPGASGN